MNEVNVLFGIAICLLPFHFAVSLESWWDEWSDQLKKDVSHDTYLNLLMLSENINSTVNMETLESFEQIFKAFDTDFVQRRNRRQYEAEGNTYYNNKMIAALYSNPRPKPDEEFDRPTRYFYKWDHFDHWFSDWPTMYVCLTQTNLARAGIGSLRKYYNIRALYMYDYQYELGYLVSDIIYHYTSLLELMNMIHNKYIKFKFRRVTSIIKEADIAPVRYMWYIYRQMAGLARKIILICEMLYSLKDKHKNVILEKGLISPFIFYPLDQEENKTFMDLIMGLLNKVTEKTKKKKKQTGLTPMMTSEERIKKKRRLSQKKRQRGMRTKVPFIYGSNKTSFHDFHYGWSIEESWAFVPSKFTPNLLDAILGIVSNAIGFFIPWLG